MTIVVSAPAQPSAGSSPSPAMAARAGGIDLAGPWRIRPVLPADPPDQPRPPDVGADSWTSIDLPAAWQTVLGANAPDACWLRRTVRVETSNENDRRAARWWLRFDAVATDVRAWVNGIVVGRHVGDWVPFQFDVTDAITPGGEAEILLRVDLCRATSPERDGDLQRGHITKGFHDVISLQHGGVWGPVRLQRTGRLVGIPDGVAVRADPQSGAVRIVVELAMTGEDPPGRADVSILDPDGRPVLDGSAPVVAGARSVEIRGTVAAPRRWSPTDPKLYTARVTLDDGTGTSEAHEVRFGFRTVRADGRRILLNDRPLLLRGVLHWGHEPQLVAPSPSPRAVRDQFTRLREMGFNCVCLCMWYAPRWVYEIADETGMLLWQEHPVWQSPMDDEHQEAYRRAYRSFLRRDRSHPSVIIVSATCEHPSFHPDLASWWWDASAEELPGTLRQVQTAFFRWADVARTDLHDEHTYENADRWVCYLEDLQQHLRTLPPKPFVMGETILYTSWPDLPGLLARAGDTRPWWLPRSIDHMVELEQAWRDRYGPAVVDRFRREGDRFHLRGRKFQVEQFRRFASNAGVVMNHLRDVPRCQCGFLDDLDGWRFDPADTRAWLGDVALLLWTPDHRQALAGAEAGDDPPLPCRVAVSNFSARHVESSVRVNLDDGAGWSRSIQTATLSCPPGSVESVPLEIPRPRVKRPTRLAIEASLPDGERNRWGLWLFPQVAAWPAGSTRLDALPFTNRESAPDEVERNYSRGWGLPARSWTSHMPDPARLAPSMRGWQGDGAVPRQCTVLLTHRLTSSIVRWLGAGGHVVLLASKAAGGLGSRYEWLFGGVPLVIESAPLGPGDSRWIVDGLVYDLVRRTGRVIPVEDLGLAGQVDPIIRLAYTHDQSERVRFFDLLFTTRVGDGVLVASGLDHSESAGRWLLGQIVGSMHAGDVQPRATLDAEILDRLAFEFGAKA
ncbi:MAG: glycoside hydrolase family 2 protein [Planctomycetota bacterium]|jgi:hypothetical protein